MKATNFIRKTLSIKRAIDVDDDMKKFIFDNINYRRHVWNDFVEESRKYDNVFDFQPYSYRSEYFRKVEQPENIYKRYCVDISKQVSRDVLHAFSMMKGKKQFNGKLRFKKFDRFRGSFKVPTRAQYVISDGYPLGRFNSRLYIDDETTMSFRVRRSEDHIKIKLKEPLFSEILYEKSTSYPFYCDKNRRYYFQEEDIKEISFLHELGKFYIVLSISMIINVKNDKHRGHLGIDVGIKNPLTCYDGSKCFVVSLSKREANRIFYLERRAKKLQKIMDQKYLANGGEKSNNYIKVQKKFRTTWKKIFNIRLNWRRKLSKRLCMAYKTIVIDMFKVSEMRKNISNTSSATKRINYCSTFHGMYYFYESLLHAGDKYNTTIFESPKNSTRTCCICHHKNPKLLLTQRTFVCEDCGNKINRDINAAINCYEADVRKLNIAVC